LSPSSAGFRGKKARAPSTSDPEAIAAILDGLLDKRPWRMGMAIGRLGHRWSEVVGERLAEETSPIGLEGGVLVVRASSASWAAQIRFLSAEVRTRVNRQLGEEGAVQVKVVVAPG